MPSGYNRDAVRGFLEQHGRLARLEKDPQLQAHLRDLFARNGLRPEPGKSLFRTFVDYALAADPSVLNGERRPFEGKLDEGDVAARLAEGLAGLGDAYGTAKLLAQVRSDYLHDGLLARRAMDDHAERPAPLPANTHAEAAGADEHERRALLERTFAAREAQGQRAAADRMGMSPRDRTLWDGSVRQVHNDRQLALEHAFAQHSGEAPVVRLSSSMQPPAEPAPRGEDGPSLHEALSAAFDQHAGNGEEENP